MSSLRAYFIDFVHMKNYNSFTLSLLFIFEGILPHSLHLRGQILYSCPALLLTQLSCLLILCLEFGSHLQFTVQSKGKIVTEIWFLIYLEAQDMPYNDDIRSEMLFIYFITLVRRCLRWNIIIILGYLHYYILRIMVSIIHKIRVIVDVM